MERLNECPSCRSKEFLPSLRVPDHFGQGEVFTLMHCTQCQLTFTNPRPDANEIIKYYKSDSYISHGQSKGLLFDLIYRQSQRLNLHYKEQLIKSYSKGNKLLDYGCGTGAFLNYMNARKYQVFGIEPNEEARHLVPKQIKRVEKIENLNEDEFDIITAYHVVEHVHELRATLKKLIQKLRHQGTLHIALPNPNSYDAQYYQTYWAGYDVPRHLYHFTHHSAIHLFKHIGLKHIATQPMKLDSYYISLLSEGYRKKSLKPLRAFWHGYRSNRLARKTKEYSSLIYMLQKT